MLLRTAWRRVATAAPAAPGPRAKPPIRGLRLRGTLGGPLAATFLEARNFLLG